MSNTTTPSSGLEQTRRLGVETTGIEIIEEAERTARPRDLFWPWFAANVSVFGISYGSFVLGFGISFCQAVVVAVVGIVVSFALCGVIAIAGKRGSAPTMVLSRAAFGVNGQKVPGVVSWLVSIGWETFLAILAVLATATIFDQLGWSGGTTTQGRRHRRRRAHDRLGECRGLPRDHADAVGADVDHRPRHHRLRAPHARRDRLVGGQRDPRRQRRSRWSARSSW